MRVVRAVTIFLLLTSITIPAAATAQELEPTLRRSQGQSSLPTESVNFPDARFGVGLPLAPPKSVIHSLPVSVAVQEDRLLPVYDDFGERIYRYEIRALMRSGAKQTLVGAVFGGSVGAGLFSLIFSSKMRCGEDAVGKRCSPQEESMRSTAPAVGGILGAATFGYLGYSIGRRSWDEALEYIRNFRRLARGADSVSPGVREEGEKK